MFVDPALQSVLLGTAILGFVGGVLGTFAVVCRRSLVGDAVAHAALPGVVLAYLACFALGTAFDSPELRKFGTNPLVLLTGAALSGWIGLCLVGWITRATKIPFDAALGGMLAVFFGFGILLMTYAQKHITGAANLGLQRLLFGQATTILEEDIQLLVGVGAVVLMVLLIFWKELKLIAFDPNFAAGLGYPVARLEALLTTLLIIAIVIGLQLVGVVLMAALIVAPATAARQWSDQFGRVVLLAGFFGSAAGIVGTLVSDALSKPGQAVPTGPTIILAGTTLAMLSLIVAPRFRRD